MNLDFNTEDMKKFDEQYVFVPKYLRLNYGDEGMVDMEDFCLGSEFVDELEALSGDLKAQAKAMLQYGDEYLDKDFEFVDLFSRDVYEMNLSGSDAGNVNGGVEDWNAVLVCAFTGFAPVHQVVGFEVAGRIERRQSDIKNITVACAW